MNRNWRNQKPNLALKTKTGNKKYIIDKRHLEHMVNRAGSYFPKVGHPATQTEHLSIKNKHKVKHHRNSGTKTGNRDHTRTTALERSVMNNWGLKHVLSAQPHPP